MIKDVDNGLLVIDARNALVDINYEIEDSETQGKLIDIMITLEFLILELLSEAMEVSENED